MIKFLREYTVTLINSRKAYLTNVIKNRTKKEKQIMIGALVGFLFFFDYFVFIQPSLAILNRVIPELNTVKSDLWSLDTDKKNRELIKLRWRQTKYAIFKEEQHFISPDELSILLENISALAADSRVKITSLVPFDKKNTEVKKEKELYSSVPIEIAGLAGAHEFGAFLAKLENNSTFYRIDYVNIFANPTQTTTHRVELGIAAYQKNGQTK